MLLAIDAIIASISVFITFVGNSASAEIIIADISWLEDVADSESEEIESDEIESDEIESDEIESDEIEPSESLTLRGLSRQGESDLSVACSSFLDC